MFSEDEAIRIEALPGLWRRSLIVRPDGSRDSMTWVRWLQGRRRFADLRQSPAVKRFRKVRGRGELRREDCLELARQEGFAGELAHEGRYFEWRRWIDYQPASGLADAGALELADGVLVERGRDIAYTEHWHRERGPTAPCWALDLERPAAATSAASAARALLLRVGECFMLARARACALAPGHSLEDCVARAPTLEAAQALIDCEISFGEVRSDHQLAILQSTLPWRVGMRLEVQVDGEGVWMPECAADGTLLRERWRILARED